MQLPPSDKEYPCNAVVFYSYIVKGVVQRMSKEKSAFIKNIIKALWKAYSFVRMIYSGKLAFQKRMLSVMLAQE